MRYNEKVEQVQATIRRYTQEMAYEHRFQLVNQVLGELTREGLVGLMEDQREEILAGFPLSAKKGWDAQVQTYRRSFAELALALAPRYASRQAEKTCL